MNHQQSNYTFRNIMEFLDAHVPVEYTHQPGAFVTNIANTTSEQEQLNGLLHFVQVNDHAWTSDVFMDIEKCETPTIVCGNAPHINLREVFEYLSTHATKRFWIMVCMCIGRSSSELAAKRQAELCTSVQDFKSDLALINVEMTADEIVEFVSANKDAIATRYMARLDRQIPIHKSDHEPFWNHMEKIFNILNPYNQIRFTSSSSHTIVTSMVDKISGMFSNQDLQEGNVDFGQVIGNILNPDMMNQMSELMQGTNPKDLVNTILSVLPDMNQVMPTSIGEE